MAIEIIKNLHEFAGQKLVAFCSSANPESFFSVLEGASKSIEKISFFENHSYEKDELEKLLNLAKNKKAILVTTREDWNKIPQQYKNNIKFLDIELSVTKKDLLTGAETVVDLQQTPEEIAMMMASELLADGKIALGPNMLTGPQIAAAVGRVGNEVREGGNNIDGNDERALAADRAEIAARIAEAKASRVSSKNSQGDPKNSEKTPDPNAASAEDGAENQGPKNAASIVPNDENTSQENGGANEKGANPFGNLPGINSAMGDLRVGINIGGDIASENNGGATPQNSADNDGQENCGPENPNEEEGENAKKEKMVR